ncbi:hypothetical protein BX666DRAFT_1852450 [Dichotomocladium elegans]|nr:hypothetical protein BX666DRAFT_1852450 [Dichotomocladium elegans]
MPIFHSSPSSGTLLAVAARVQPIDRIVRIFVKAADGLVASSSSSSSSTTISALEPLDNGPAITRVKRGIIHTYFSCTLYFTPLLVQPYFLDYLLMNPHSMLANAVVTFVSHGPCEHVSIAIPNLSRGAFAAMMFEKTYSQLREVLFEDESLDTMITVWYLASCLMTNLRMDEARVLMTLAWQMAIQLKATYVPILEKSDWDDPVSLARAETWRRLFYQIRYIELSLASMQDNSLDIYQFTAASKKVGSPVVLPSEKVDGALSRAVDIYRHLIALSMLLGGFDKTTREEIVGQNLYAGIIDNVSQVDIAIIEQRLIEYWISLPRAYVLADQPIMSTLDMNRIRDCKLPSVLYLNMMYYLYWIVIHMRLMSPPETADLTGASLGRLDGDHALVIVSVCCDAVAKLALVLFEKEPCVNDIHWVMIVADLLLLLRNAANNTIRARAEQNLRWIMVVLSNIVDRFNRPNTSTVIPSTYYGEIKSIVTQHFLTQSVQ